MSDSDTILVSSDDPAVRQLLPGYLERRRTDVITMRQSLADSDLDAVAQTGHRMRGSGTAYGIPSITEIGTDIDRSARAGNVEAVAAAIDRLAEFLTRARLP